MSSSRIASLIGLIGSVAAVATALAGVLPPKWAAVAASVGTVLAAFNERVHGGLSTK